MARNCNRKFLVNMGKKFFEITELWDKLPREVVKFLSLEVFKKHLCAFLHSLLFKPGEHAIAGVLY